MSLIKGLKWLQKILQARRFLTNRRDNRREFFYKSELNVKSNQNEFLNYLNILKWNYKMILGSNSLIPQSLLEIRKEKCQKEFCMVNVRWKYSTYDK